MPVLAQGSFFSRPHPISKRSSRRSKQGAGSAGMEITNFRDGDSEFSRISGILPPIHPRLLQDCEAHDEVPSEGSKIILGFRFCSRFSTIHEDIHSCPTRRPPRVVT